MPRSTPILPLCTVVGTRASPELAPCPPELAAPCSVPSMLSGNSTVFLLSNELAAVSLPPSPCQPAGAQLLLSRDVGGESWSGQTTSAYGEGSAEVFMSSAASGALSATVLDASNGALRACPLQLQVRFVGGTQFACLAASSWVDLPQVLNGQCFGANASSTVTTMRRGVCRFSATGINPACANACLWNTTAAGGEISLIAPGVALYSTRATPCVSSGLQILLSFDAVSSQWVGATADPSMLAGISFATSLHLALSVKRGGNVSALFTVDRVDEDTIACPKVTLQVYIVSHF